MKYRKTFFFFLYHAILMAVLGSAMPASQPKPVSGQKPVTHPIYFRGTGTKPTWSLSLAEDEFTFQSDSNGYQYMGFPPAEPFKGESAGIKHFNTTNDDAQLMVTTYEMPCTNEGSRERFPYSVDVQVNWKSGRTGTFHGCGTYVTDGRLKGHWQIISVMEDSIQHLGKVDTLIYIQIEPSSNSFAGFTGCNSITGRLYYERKLLRFTDFARSKAICDPDKIEPAIIKALQFSVNYEVTADELRLFNPSRTTMRLKKIGQ